jgi:rhomboid protease GluP
MSSEAAAPAPEQQPSAPPAQRQYGRLTMGLIAVNVLVFVLMSITSSSFLNPSSEILLKWGADYGPLTLHGQWWRMVTALFVHIGVMHLLLNMYVLLSIGPFMEIRIGKAAYLPFYFAAGLLGNALSLAWHPFTVSAGASGAIFGLYGGLFGWLLRHHRSASLEGLRSLRNGAVVFVLYNLVYGVANPDIDLAAHLGGLAAGLVLGLFLPTTGEQADDSSARAVISSVIAIALAFGIAAQLPKPDDLQAEVKRMADMETRTLALFNSSLQKWKGDQLTNDQFLQILNSQVVPQWHAERVALGNLHRLSNEQSRLAASLVQYMDTRESSWQLLAEGVRTDNVAKIKEANAKEEEADRQASAIGK